MVDHAFFVIYDDLLALVTLAGIDTGSVLQAFRRGAEIAIGPLVQIFNNISVSFLNVTILADDNIRQGILAYTAGHDSTALRQWALQSIVFVLVC